jgi:hypothetical protein
MSTHNSEPPGKYICNICGGDDIQRDAVVSWDITTQAWEVESVYDAGYCDTCEEEMKFFKWVELNLRDHVAAVVEARAATLCPVVPEEGA